MPAIQCNHKCHTQGLNDWIEACPICGCPNPSYDPSIPVPTTFEELMKACEEQDKRRAAYEGRRQ